MIEGGGIMSMMMTQYELHQNHLVSTVVCRQLLALTIPCLPFLATWTSKKAPKGLTPTTPPDKGIPGDNSLINVTFWVFWTLCIIQTTSLKGSKKRLMLPLHHNMYIHIPPPL